MHSDAGFYKSLKKIIKNIMLSKEIERLKKEGIFRQIKDRMIGAGLSKIVIDDLEYINFASNDYLGLSGHPSILDAAKRAIDVYGFGSGASRLLSGGTELHARLEKEVADLKQTDASLVFNSGYTANVSVIPAIAGEGDVILSDELNHASIIDGCRLSRAKTVIYRHGDVNHLSDLLKKEKANKRIIITDSVFSMDGDIAPLKDIYLLCDSLINSGHYPPESILLYIDDAHGTGVLGDGNGALRHFGIKPETWIIQMGTFSKALGSFGGFVAASKDIIEWLINKARGSIFSTALPPCVIAASIEALYILKKEHYRLERLWFNREMLFKEIKSLGFNTLNTETPIIPIIVGDNEMTLRFSDFLFKNGIYAPAIRIPAVKTPRIRITVTAAHKESDLEKMIDLLSKAKML